MYVSSGRRTVRRGKAQSLSATTATAVGVTAAVLFAGALETVRGAIGQSNVAVALTLVVVTAATFGDRITGLLVGCAAALGYNFFHTQPVHTLRISDPADVITVVLLAVVGVVVGQIAEMRRRATRRAMSQGNELRRLRSIIAMVDAGAPVTEVWEAIRGALVADLHVVAAHYEAASSEPSANEALPSLRADGSISGAQMLLFEPVGFALPEEGITVPVTVGSRTLGRIVLVPGPRTGTTTEQRRGVVALADLLAMALPPDGSAPVLS